MFKGNEKTGKTAYVKNRDNSQLAERGADNQKPAVTKYETPMAKKRQQARNEKHKSSKGNHNRKSGHDKKIYKASA